MTAAHQLPTIETAPPSELLRALSTIGLAWSAELPAPAESVDEALALGPDGLWRSPEVLPFAPDGLTLSEALGMTCAVLWAAMAEAKAFRAPVRLSPAARAPGSRRWLIRLPGFEAESEVTAEAGVDLLRALLVVRRILWPTQAWTRRDQIAATIELHLRAMEAELRGPAPVVTLNPAVNRSDLGRDWS